MMGIASRPTSRSLRGSQEEEGEEEEEEEENQVPVWVLGQLLLMTLLRFSLTWFAARCWVLPEEYCGFLGDDFWFILVFSFAWFDSGYMFFPVYGGFCTRILRLILVLLSCSLFAAKSTGIGMVPRSCRQRHWYAWAGFAGVDPLRAMFPSFGVFLRPVVPGSHLFRAGVA